MSRPTESDRLEAGATPELAPREDRWPALLACRTIDDALAEVAGWPARPPFGLILDDADGRSIATWGEPTALDGPRVTIPGLPPWRLTIAPREGEGDAGPDDVSLVAAALEAWRASAGERSRMEERLARRTRELDLIQTLGRRASEAASPLELFQATVAALHQGERIDLALVAHAVDGAAESIAFLARPVTDETLGALVRRAGGMLGWPANDLPVTRRVELDTYDGGERAREAFRDRDLVLLPVLRRRRAVACLVVVPAEREGDGALRLLYSAANHLSIHLDRILAVREAEADRFRSILDSMPQAVLLTDARLRIQLANRSARTTFDRLRLPAAGDLSEAAARLGLLEAIDRVRTGGAPVADAEVVVDGDRVLAVTVSPLSGAAAAGHDLVLVWADVSDSRRMQRRLAQSEKMSSLGQMISGVAHELNNPLASILGYAQLLRTTSTDDRTRGRLDTLRTEAERCRRIVHNLLSFARRRAPERTTGSINEIVQSVVALMGYQLRVDGVTLTTELDGNAPALRCDLHQLQQVLVNLLTNARDAIAEAGRPGAVTIRTSVEEGEAAVRLDIVDDGPGVADELRHRIFDPFVTTKAEGRGTGLGLSLVYGIVSDHGGTIEVLSREEAAGPGAHFRLRLPVGEHAKVDDAPLLRRPASTAPPARGRILVVDDEQPLARMMCDALVEAGHEADTASDGREALERLNGASYDLVISDLKMPGMGGERLIDEIRRLRPALADRLLLTTGDTISEDSAAVAGRIGLPVLHKPFDIDELQRVVDGRLRAPRDA